MNRTIHLPIILALFAASGACSKDAKPTTPPPDATAQTAAAETGETEAGGGEEAPKAPADAIMIGAFNLNWAFDDLGDKRPKKAQPYLAKNEDWTWKRDRIVEVLLKEKLDVVALLELGGERELIDITSWLREKGGYDYETAFVEGLDKSTGQQIAILSRYPISNARRYDVDIEKQVVADVELPTGVTMVVMAVHMHELPQPKYQSLRRKAARALKQKLKADKETRPMVILGTFGETAKTYDEDYDQHTPGILAGKHTKPETDDCADSAASAASTNIKQEPFDRIFACGLELRSADISSEDLIVRGDPDPADQPWTTIPIDKDPKRDVSDHYLLRAELAMPKPAPPPAPEGSEDKAEKKE